jgi:hypothetical protein
MNQRVSNGSSDDLKEANNMVLATRSSTPDDLMMRRTIALEQFY